jgi:hypothetical protein
MKKVPCPEVTTRTEFVDGRGRLIVRFGWDSVSFEMFDDEALRLAREIHDALEDQTEDWFPTHRSRVDGSPARIIGTVPDRFGIISETTFYFDNEDGLVWSDEIDQWMAIEDAECDACGRNDVVGCIGGTHYFCTRHEDTVAEMHISDEEMDRMSGEIYTD